MEEQDQVTLKVRDIQMIALEMLDVFDAFCAKHRLSYSLCGGTLLGAVRHRGFIPWDDDLDVFMVRPEYEKLVRICKADALGEGMTFACPENGRFLRPFARIYYDRTSVWRKSFSEASGAHVWMDILPVDGLPPDPGKWKNLYFRRKMMDHFNTMALWKVARRKTLPDTAKWMIYHLIGCGWRGPEGGARQWCRRLDRFSRRYPFECSEYVACISGGRYGPGEAMLREAYLQPAVVEFEGRKLPAMGCWHEYLSGIFGDYMQLPPENMRHPHLNRTTMSADDYFRLCERHPELAGLHPEAGL